MNKLQLITVGTGMTGTMTERMIDSLNKAEHIVLRTVRHPVAAYLDSKQISYITLDELYEKTEDFDEFNRAAAACIKRLLSQSSFCYCVADPATDSTVASIRKVIPAESIEVIPGITLTQACLSLCEYTGGLRSYSAEDFRNAPSVPEENLLLVELHSRECAGVCKLDLLKFLPEELEITFITGNEKTGEMSASTVPLYEMDRQKVYDHLTAVFIPAVAMAERTRYTVRDLVSIMHKLTDFGGCEWDAGQTHESLMPYLLEESCEFLQAVREDDPDHMADELGDVLLQIVFHADVARRHGEFEMADVSSAICEKMIHRHPSQFGGGTMKGSEDWERIKRESNGIKSDAEAMRAVSAGLSPMLRAAKVQSKSGKAPYADVNDAIAAVVIACDKMKRVKSEEALGEMLFACAGVARLSGFDCDVALLDKVEKYICEFEKQK